MLINYKKILAVFLMVCSTAVYCQSDKQHSVAEFTLDNDFFFFIDRYYTSGIVLKFSNDWLKKSPINSILLPNSKNDKVYYAISLKQKIFTPEKTSTPFIVTNDRPYASYILIGSHKTSFNKDKSLKLTSSLEFGLLGNASGAKEFQNFVHKFIPYAYSSYGWHHQMNNDICLMYSAEIEKGLINLPNIEINGIVGATLGVPHTEAKIGSYMRVGVFDDYFRGISVDISPEFSAWLFCSGWVYLVNYNATLQGGAYSQDNDHIFGEINSPILHAKYGAAASFRRISIEYGYEVRSPEFKNGWWHRWGHVVIYFAI